MNGVVSARSLTSEALLDMLPVGKREEFAHRTLAGLEGRSDYEEMREHIPRLVRVPLQHAI